MFKEVPAQFDFPAAEREILAFWQAESVYEQTLRRRAGAEPFVFYEGPPTANGLPHPGHCLTRIIKDVFPRYRTMCGQYCQRKAGWDTHGLPVEAEVCKELGIHTKQEIEQYGIEKFIHLCQQSVFRYTREWEELTRRLGFWINLDEAYVTYHQSYVESVWWALKTLFDRGLLFQRHKVVWWWPQGGTALSAGEVGQGYREVDDPSVYLRLQIVHDAIALNLALPGNTSLLVWTTTPWTLPSNMFVAAHGTTSYALIQDQASNEHFIIASSLWEQLAVKMRRQNWRVVRQLVGGELHGLRYVPPFRECYYDREANDLFGFGDSTKLGELMVRTQSGDSYLAWRVILASFVSRDRGTGLVHQAPAFGEDDHHLWLQAFWDSVCPPYNEFMPCAVEPDGTFSCSAPLKYQGRNAKACDREIVRDLNERGLLMHQETVRHEYPFCWRAEEDPLIQYARKSWFVRTTDFREKFLTNNAAINWLPEHIREGRFGNFLRDNVDWALSRERFWGTPLPIWQCEQTGKQDAIACYAELLAKPGVRGTEVWEQAKAANPELIDDLKVHKPYIDAVTYDSPYAAGARMVRVPEVIDCWFDSGSMPFAQWGYPHVPDSAERFKQAFPADFISEAIDQTRGWFYTLLAISTMLFGEETAGVAYPHPFRNCIVLGLMNGEDGKKLSKSKRNYKEPTYIFDREGADAMRWSMLSSQAPWTGARFKEETIATDQREFLIKLYNVYSFFVIYANIDQWSPSATAEVISFRSELDRWILAELQQTIVDVRAAMDRYENYPACRRLVEFVDGLSNWYVRRSRDRFWRSGMDGDKAAAYHTLWHCLSELSKVIAPFVPFFAETLYQNLVRGQMPDAPSSVHLCDYPQPDESLLDAKLLAEMAIVREIASLGRAARMDAKLKVRQPLPVVELVLADPGHRTWLEGHLALIADELNVKAVEFAADADRYVSYEVRPNFKSLGPKFGPLAPRIKPALASAKAAELRRGLDEKGEAVLQVGDQQVTLTPDDVQVSLKAKEGWAAAQGRQVVVVLSTQLTAELKAEGIARDVVHLIQTARKNDQLDYQDRIRVVVDTVSPVSDAILTFKEYICQETLAREILIDRSVLDPPHSGEIEETAIRFTVEVLS